MTHETRDFPASVAHQMMMRRSGGINSHWFRHGYITDLGNCDRAIVRRALDWLIQRHAMLRSTFVHVDGRAVQRIASTGSAVLEERDLAAIPADAREDAINADRLEFLARDFDVESGPLVAGRLLYVEHERCVLMWTLHHMLFDGHSGLLLMDEFRQVLEALIAGREPSLLDSVSYTDFVLAQAARLDPATMAEHVRFWQSKIQDIRPLAVGARLPYDGDGPAPAESVFLELPITIGHEVQRAARALNVPRSKYVAAAIFALLHEETGEHDLHFETFLTRREPRYASTIGMFLAIVLVRLTCPRDARFRDLLQTTIAALDESDRHCDVPTEAALAPDTRRSNVVVNFVWADPRRGEKRSFRPFPIVFESRRVANVDIMINFYKVEHVSITYATDRYDAASIRALWARFGELLERITRDPDTLISRR